MTSLAREHPWRKHSSSNQLPASVVSRFRERRQSSGRFVSRGPRICRLFLLPPETQTLAYNRASSSKGGPSDVITCFSCLRRLTAGSESPSSSVAARFTFWKSSNSRAFSRANWESNNTTKLVNFSAEARATNCANLNYFRWKVNHFRYMNSKALVTDTCNNGPRL